MERKYQDQVRLLLRIAPEIAKISEFALHGGTAINLFHHNMPRLSVDIDLTYVPYRRRENDLARISELLHLLSDRLKIIIPGIHIRQSAMDGDDIKLFCQLNNVEVKIEVNTINRGIMSVVERHALCEATQDYFEMFVEMNLVPSSQLFGGKMVAALDRQHPRDLFDTKKMLDRNEFNDEIMKGFLFCLFSSKRPFVEILDPNFQMNENIIKNQFSGMTNEEFSPEMYNSERERLITTIHRTLTSKEKKMIVSVAKGEPEWIYGDWSGFPGIAWKLKNIEILKKNNLPKYIMQVDKLERLLLRRA
ncbi:MAG: nucleotidyl transferase AbiEii/AbiGii toxin family protein [Bacteroidales bacterium]